MKTYDFVKVHFKDVRELINAIKEYRRVKKIAKGEKTLFDLLI